MAIFNLISGDYYNKLGQTVGQRFGNKRKVRRYVVPKDPKTQAQLEVRENFSSNTFITSLALMLNDKCTFFSSMQEQSYNLRMKTADFNETQYETTLQKLPLIPQKNFARYLVTEIFVYAIRGNGEITFSVKCELPPEKRKVNFAITNKDIFTSENDVLIINCENTEETPTIFKGRYNDEIPITSNTRVRCVSNDDEISENDMILSNEVMLQETSSLLIPFNAEVLSVETVDDITEIVFAQKMNVSSGNVNLVSSSVISNFEYVVGDFAEISLINKNGNACAILKQNNFSQNNAYCWGEGCQIILSNIQILDGDFTYFANNISIEVAETNNKLHRYNVANGVGYANEDKLIISQECPIKLVLSEVEFKATSMYLYGEIIDTFKIIYEKLFQTPNNLEIQMSFTSSLSKLSNLQYLIFPTVTDDCFSGVRIVGTFKGLRFLIETEKTTFDRARGIFHKTITPHFTNVLDNNLVNVESDVAVGEDWYYRTIHDHITTNFNGIVSADTYDYEVSDHWQRTKGKLRVVVPQPTEKRACRINCFLKIDTWNYSSQNYGLTFNESITPIYNNYKFTELQKDVIGENCKLFGTWEMNQTWMRTNGEMTLLIPNVHILESLRSRLEVGAISFKKIVMTFENASEGKVVAQSTIIKKTFFDNDGLKVVFGDFSYIRGQVSDDLLIDFHGDFEKGSFKIATENSTFTGLIFSVLDGNKELFFVSKVGEVLTNMTLQKEVENGNFNGLNAPISFQVV